MAGSMNPLWAIGLAAGLVACVDDAVSPAQRANEPAARPRTLGVVEVTISGIGTGAERSTAISARDVGELQSLRAAPAIDGSGTAPGGLAPQGFTLPYDGADGGDGTIQLEPVSTGSFTVGTRVTGGYRYVYAAYRVRNAQADGTPYETPRKNLTFYAVDTDGTIGKTAVSSLRRFDGGAADPDLAAQLIPTGAVVRNPQSLEIEPAGPDVLQVLTETEAETILSLAGEGVVDVFPYGFVVRNPSDPTCRTLLPDPSPGQFDGVVTFTFKVPLQASAADDPFTVSVVFLAVDDDEVRITQATEEHTRAGHAAFDARAAAIGAGVLTLLPSGGGTVWTDRAARLLCEVRVAGPAGSPAATLTSTGPTEPWLMISPLRPESRTLPRTVRMAVARCPGIASSDSASFAVHGFQSGRNRADGYGGVGTSLVRAPGGPNGSYFPGEEVEVTLTTALGATSPVVARYRVAATGGSGVFEGGATHDLGSGPASIAVGDLDGDGKLDLVTANAEADSVSVLLNQGGGSFGQHTTYRVGSYPRSVALGDLDGDGDLGMVVASADLDSVVVFSNSGGTFSRRAAYSAGDRPESIALGDVNGDGRLDIVVANANSNDVSVLLNDGSGSFATGGAYGVGTRPRWVRLGDVDGDGSLDVVATALEGTVRVRLNQ